MASFSIQELLGLGKDSNSNNSNSSSKNEGSGNSEAELSGATKNSKHDADANNKPRAAGAEPEPAEPEDTDKDIDVETLDEENAAAEPVGAEMPRRIVHTTSPQAPQGIIRGASRKRKRSKQAEEISDEDYPECAGPSSSSSSGHSSNHKSEERRSSGSTRRTPKPTTKRMRTAFTTAQLRALEYSFRMCPYPDSYGREQIASLTGINESKIQVWFQNRRARYRKREKPLEAQKSSSSGPSAMQNSAAFAHHSAMMQAYFTAAALQQGGVRLPAMTPTTMPLGPLPLPQQFYTAPNNPFIATMPSAATPISYPPPPGPLFTYPATSPMNLDLMAAAAQIQRQQAAAKQNQPHDQEKQSPPK